MEARLLLWSAPEIDTSLCWHEFEIASAFCAELRNPELTLIIHFAKRILWLLRREETRRFGKRNPASSLPVRQTSQR